MFPEKIEPDIKGLWDDRNGTYFLRLKTNEEGFPGGYQPSILMSGEREVQALLIKEPGKSISFYVYNILVYSEMS